MDKKEINSTTQKINSVADKSEALNIVLSETRLQFDTLVQLQMEERKEILKQNNDEKEKMRKHYGRIITGLLLTLFIFIGSIIGGVIYIVSNYEFGVVETSQTVSSDNSSFVYVSDGIHTNYP